MPGTIGTRDSRRAARIDEVPVRIGIVEILRDRRIGSRIDLALERDEVLLRRARLRVAFGVGGDVDVEPVARLAADERARARSRSGNRPRRTSRTADRRAARPRGVSRATCTCASTSRDRRARAADARNVRRRRHPFGAELEHRGERAFARRAAGAERDRAERRLQLRELPSRRAELLDAFRRARREEFEAEQAIRRCRHRRRGRRVDRSAVASAAEARRAATKSGCRRSRRRTPPRTR